MSIERRIPNAPEPLGDDSTEPSRNPEPNTDGDAIEPVGGLVMTDEMRSKLETAVTGFAIATAQEQHDFFKRVFDDNNRYFFFSPAWEVEDHLPRAFPEENPEDVVADHLRAIFDQSDLENEALGVFIRPNHSRSEIGVVSIVNELCEKASNSIVDSGEKALFDGCMDGWANGETEKFHIAAMYLPYAPQLLFTLYLNLYPDWITDNAVLEYLREPLIYSGRSRW